MIIIVRITEKTITPAITIPVISAVFEFDSPKAEESETLRAEMMSDSTIPSDGEKTRISKDSDVTKCGVSLKFTVAAIPFETGGCAERKSRGDPVKLEVAEEEGDSDLVDNDETVGHGVFDCEAVGEFEGQKVCVGQ
jgi:hypothetical protein